MRKIKTKAIEYNPAHESHGYRGVRWVENVSRGLRFVGFADEIAHLNHKGWYSRDEEFDEVYRGVVYQLPARDGEAQFVYGYADPNNDDCALLCFDVETDKADAARSADRFAEILAEEERAYNRAWQAGRRCEDLDEKIKQLRADALAIGAEMRAARRAVGGTLATTVPAICNALREKVGSLYRAIQKARAEREELKNDYGSAPGFEE